MRSRSVAGAVLVTGWLTLGCANAASPGVPSSGGATSATPEVSPPSSEPSATPQVASPSADAAGDSVPEGPLGSGTYTSTTLGLTVEFAIADDGWVAVPDLEEVGFALEREGISGGVTVTHFPGEVFAEPCSPEQTEMIERSADSFVGWLSDHPALDATAPVETTLGGQVAVQLDVDAAVGEPCPDSPRIWLWVLPVVGDFHLDEGEAARFLVADAGDKTIVVVIEVFEASDFQALLEAAEPLLASMSIEP
jgi:hypothetical protein